MRGAVGGLRGLGLQLIKGTTTEELPPLSAYLSAAQVNKGGVGVGRSQLKACCDRIGSNLEYSRNIALTCTCNSLADHPPLTHRICPANTRQLLPAVDNSQTCWLHLSFDCRPFAIDAGSLFNDHC